MLSVFFVPAKEASDSGLQEIDMRRLGRMVALAGKNGAGKTRILEKLRFYVDARLVSVPQTASTQQSLNHARQLIQTNPNSEHVEIWKEQVVSYEFQLQLARERVITTHGLFKALSFVPKSLTLADPWSAPRDQIPSRHSAAQNPGFTNFSELCLFYVEQVVTLHWNASHQGYAGPSSDKEIAISEYERLQTLTKQLLGVAFGRDLEGRPTLFGKPVSASGISDGQRVLLQLCVALHAQRASLENTVFLLDEPENHLHPSAAVDLLKFLYENTTNSQIWVATHSVPLLAYMTSVEPMSLWYVKDGSVSNAGKHPESVLSSLLGGEEEIAKLHAFTGLPAQLAAINYAAESLLAPKAIGNGRGDPQVSQVHSALISPVEGQRIRVLDFGAGKGRLLEGMSAIALDSGTDISNAIDYFAHNLPCKDEIYCRKTIESIYGSNEKRYFESIDEYFSHRDPGSIDVVVMCNVLHEIPPHKWPEIFSPNSLIGRALSDEGYLLIVEDQRIPVGELAHEYGFIVLDTPHLRTLFNIKQQHNETEKFKVNDARKDGRLKAHWIAKELIANATNTSVRLAISEVAATSKREIEAIRSKPKTYANGQLHGFWTQQLANASIFLG